MLSLPKDTRIPTLYTFSQSALLTSVEHCKAKRVIFKCAGSHAGSLSRTEEPFWSWEFWSRINQSMSLNWD